MFFAALQYQSAILLSGMTLPYSSSSPAVSDEKRQECGQIGHVMKRLLELNIKPQDIVTRKVRDTQGCTCRKCNLKYVCRFISLLILLFLVTLFHQALENAFRLVTILGGSTNAVLHLIAIARTAQVDFTMEDCQRLSNSTPLLADLKPSGKYLMEDIFKYGNGGLIRLI